MPQLVGGIGAPKPGDETSTGVLNQVKVALLEKVVSGGRRSSLTLEGFDPRPHSYKTQLVAGTNFFIKVKVGEGDFIHARIYRDLSGQVTLHGIADDKTEQDEITYFE